MKKLISWNVNGLRACIGKGFSEAMASLDPDVICIQETKLQAGQLEMPEDEYFRYWNYAEKKGYSGTAVFTKDEPLSVSYGLGEFLEDNEGRVITLEFPEYYLINVYTPNAQRELARLEYRMKWDDAFREYAAMLSEKKSVVVCGDMNVAHNEIDLKNPKTNRGNAGFSDEERDKFTKFLEAGFVDSFRHFYPDLEGAYSWWSYMFNARKNNAGWRIDYFCVSESMKDKLVSAAIHPEIFGSDHCPVEVVLNL